MYVCFKLIAGVAHAGEARKGVTRVRTEGSAALEGKERRERDDACTRKDERRNSAPPFARVVGCLLNHTKCNLEGRGLPITKKKCLPFAKHVGHAEDKNEALNNTSSCIQWRATSDASNVRIALRK